MSIQIVPPTEKQLEFFHSLARQLKIDNPEVPKSKNAATMKIGEYKYELTTGQLAALSEKMRMEPADFDVTAISQAIDRKILGHASMQAQNVDRIHEIGVEGDDPTIAARQQELRARFERPYLQKHVDFELARLNLIHQQKLTGIQADLADAAAPYEQRYKTMLSELRRIKHLPTRRQRSRIVGYAERTGIGLLVPETRQAASKLIQELNAEHESASRAADNGNTPAETSDGLPDEAMGISLKQEAALGGADGTAYRADEYERQSPAPWEDEVERNQTANFSAAERAEHAKEQREAQFSNEEIDSVRVQMTDEMDPGVIRERLGNLEQLASRAGIDASQFRAEGDGPISFTSIEQGEKFLDLVALDRSYASAPVPQAQSDTPVPARGEWGDAEYEVVPPTEKQQTFYNDLLSQTGVRERGPEEDALPIEGVRIFEDSINPPETKQEMMHAINELQGRLTENKQLADTLHTVERMTPEQIEEIGRGMRPAEYTVFEERFRLQMGRSEVAESMGVSDATVKQLEKTVASKVSRLAPGIAPAAGAGASADISAAQLAKVEAAAATHLPM